LQENFAWSKQTAARMMQVAQRFKSLTVRDLPIETGALYLLAEKATPAAFVEEVIDVAKEGTVITQDKTKKMLTTYKELHTPTKKPPSAPVGDTNAAPQMSADIPSASPSSLVTVAPIANGHQVASTSSAPPLILIPDPPPVINGQRPTFNSTNEQVDWAKWTWNPVTGCLHNCVYCYARDIAERRMGAYKDIGFTPHFHEDRLKAPHYTLVPEKAEEQIGYRNVFVCSMADLSGKWVPQEWIDAVLEEVRAAPQWNFLFLTKFPQRLAEIDWPANAWVGTTVDEQYRVEIAERAFRKVQAPVKWLSCEPPRERLTFSSLAMFDWVVLGGQSKSSQAPAFQPPWEWVEHLWHQARAAQCLVYWKPNLETRPQEYPG